MTASHANRSASYLLAVLDHVPSFVAVIDREMRCRFANAAALRWIGRRYRGQVIGRHLEELLPPDIYRRTLPHAQAALAGEVRECRRDFVDDNGAAHEVQVVYTPKRLAGHSDGFYVSVTEITAAT